MVDRILGPADVFVCGWFFTGFMLAAFKYGSVVILEDNPRGPALVLRWGVIVLIIALGIGLMILGVFLFLRHLF